MSKNTLLAVDTAAHDPARHIVAAAVMTRELAHDSGDHVIVLHVHEFAVGRFGRIRIDCADGKAKRWSRRSCPTSGRRGSAQKARSPRPIRATLRRPSWPRPSITTRVSWG